MQFEVQLIFTVLYYNISNRSNISFEPLSQIEALKNKIKTFLRSKLMTKGYSMILSL